jgi:hypothetical protein
MAHPNPTPPKGPGRPKGCKNAVPKQAKVVLAEAARGHTDRALQVLVDVATSKSSASAARVSAAVALIEFGHGKARQAIDMQGDLRVEVRGLSDEELDARISSLVASLSG